MLVTVLFILAFPIKFSRFTLEHEASTDHYSGEYLAFADVNGDGSDDFIACGSGLYTGPDQSACVCRGLKDDYGTFVIDQLNVPNLIKGSASVMRSNYDGDVYDEVLIPSAEGAEVWLYVFEGPHLSLPTRRLLLDTLGFDDEKDMLSAQKIAEHDSDGDGYAEVLISVKNGFPIYPRRNYLIDLHRGEVRRSPATSVGLIISEMQELPEGGRMFTGTNSIPGNDHHANALPYSDMHGYAFAFDDSLEFLFPPVPVGDYPGRVGNYFMDGFLFTYIYHNSDERYAVLQKRELPGGTLLDSLVLDDIEATPVHHDRGLLISGKGKALIVNSDLEIVSEIIHPAVDMSRHIPDLTGDGRAEYVFHDRPTGVITVFDHSMKHPASLATKFYDIRKFLVREDAAGKRRLAFLADRGVHFFRYEANPWHAFRWPYYLGVFALSLLLSHYLFGKYRRNIELRYVRERELNRLQVLALKNQVDPHFTLNALNSIDQMYRTGEPERASRFMERLTRLVYATVRDSDKAVSTLQNELDFCRNYCALEQYKTPDFDFEIEVAEDIDLFEVPIPKQFIFTHVENAIKHGLRPAKGAKKLEISVKTEGTHIVIRVYNNGLPFTREDMTNHKPDSVKSTGKGLKLLNNMKAIYEKLGMGGISYHIKPCREGGTLAVIHVRLTREKPGRYPTKAGVSA